MGLICNCCMTYLVCVLWSTGAPTYLTVSISSGQSHLCMSFTRNKQWALEFEMFVYDWRHYSCLNSWYVLNLGLAWTSLSHSSLSNLKKILKITFLFTQVATGIVLPPLKQVTTWFVSVVGVYVFTRDVQFLIPLFSAYLLPSILVHLLYTLVVNDIH